MKPHLEFRVLRGCHLFAAAVLIALSTCGAGPLEAQPPVRSRGDAVISKRAGGSAIRITTTARLAGAIHSLTWNGKEFIDSFDHGRQLQSACSFNVGRRSFHAECYNPTEAGSRSDGRGNRSTSQLLKFATGPGELETTTRMAFWLQPGQKSQGRLALNTTRRSRHIVTKRVRIGYRNLPQVLDYQVTFTVPDGERHTYAQFEALTGYMPAEFESFLIYEPATARLRPLSDGPGEQQFPVVLSTRDGRYAMGVYSPQQPSPGYRNAGYGRFRFAAQRVVKWNCVFRVRAKDGIQPGQYRYQMFVPIGTREDVRRSFEALHTSGPRGKG